MKTHFHFAFAFLLLLVKTYPLLAQQIIFNRVSTTFWGGLGIAQDPQGYMWFVGNGLHRYDGYTSVSYFNDPSNPRSLAANQLEAICADHNGIIWIGTQTLGLDRFDPATGVFTHFRHKPEDLTRLSNDTVRAVLADPEGTIWVGTVGGLDKLDQKKGTFTHYSHDPKDSTSLSNNHVSALYEDPDGTLWIGTGSPFFEQGEGGLNRFDKKTGKFIRYLHDPKNPHSLINNKVRAIFEDSRETFWVGTAGDGLHTMNKQTGKFERHCYNPAYPERLSRPPLKNKKVQFWSDDVITFINEDGAGAIWIGTFQGGLSRYDAKTKKLTHYQSLKDSLPRKDATCFWWTYTSKEGVIWIATWEGLFRTDPFLKSVPHFATGSAVNRMYEDTSGVLWLGTNDGLIRNDRKNGSIKRFVHEKNNPFSLTSNSIWSIREDHSGILWVGTDNGLNRFNSKTQTFTRYQNQPESDNSISSGLVDVIYEDRHGSLWVAPYGGGLDRMDTQTGNFIHYRSKQQDTNSLSMPSISCIQEDRFGYLWIGTLEGGGLNRLQPQTGKFKRYLRGTDISSILEDSNGIIWVATGSGLYRYEQSSDNFSYFIDPGAGITGPFIAAAILEDDQKNLWINSSIGIIRLNSQRNQTTIYNKNHRVMVEDFAGESGSWKGKKGELFFGDLKGYYAFFPNEFIVNPKAPEVVISDFRLADKSVKPEKDGPLNEPLMQTKEIRLHYNQNVFSFDFAGIHYSSPEENRHLLMLENLDNTWRKAGEEKTAYYYNVPPGRYVFRVKAANSDGVWAEKSIAVIVAPPWWRTWWAYILFALLFAGLIYVFIQYRINKIRMQHEIVLQQHKATELEMQALRAQMNPHFIFNSLNAINRFILQNNKLQASEYLTKFSRLVRLILQNSQASLIPLESELEALQLYLELEAVRFDHQFEYKIKVDDELDAEILKVPPLIIQPYAENAIWHGLMHKEERGHLNIDVSQEDSHLFFKITDDGIGRKQAALASKSATRHKSMGLRITADRIAMIQNTNGNESPVTINDLVNADGSAAGTEVIIKMPVKYD
ncbi:MAG: histidine kinase [Chitinophagaceae bacterium]|nr:histidine kinase [Chitinophagaceae bacterium]